MNKIPLFIRSKNRLQQLYFTLNSLLSTNAKELCDITIIDDKSSDKKTIQFLTTNNKILITDFESRYSNFMQNQQFQKIVSYIMPKTKTIITRN